MKASKPHLSTTQIIALGFLSAILAGGLLLSLPIASAKGTATPFIDALFTATTSVCVTGLVVVQTSSHWSLFGQMVILFLIQLGGLGVVSVATMVMMLIGRRITLKNRLLLEDALNLNTLSGLIKFLKKVLKGTFFIEGIGCILYCLVFIPEYGWRKGFWISLFNAVSAFCNAGIDIIGAVSLADYVTHPLINFVTMLLIVMGGIGFIVWEDIANSLRKLRNREVQDKKWWPRLQLHTRLVLITTAILIIGGALLILLFEYNNPNTIGSLTFFEKVQASLFQSVTTRTAGFFTFSQKNMVPTSAVICILLMFIGGSPIGTAGGIKTTTLALLFLSAISTIKGERHVVVFHKRISHEIIKKALAVTIVSTVILLTLTILLYHLEGGALLDTLFETTSAIATVGLTRDYTPLLHMPGKAIIILLMYLGRIGPISLAIILGSRSQKAIISYPKEDIIVG